MITISDTKSTLPAIQQDDYRAFFQGFNLLLFEFDTPCKVAHHACVLYRVFVPFCTSEADQLFYSIGGDSPAPINVVRGY